MRHALITLFTLPTMALFTGCGDDSGSNGSGIDAHVSVTDAGTVITAPTCARADVEAAIAQAADGETVAVPAGNCTWSTCFTLTKGIHLMGAGASVLTIDLGGTCGITKNPTHSIELSGFTFNDGGAGTLFEVGGEWSAEPPLIHDNVFNVDGGQILLYRTNGGVIYGNTLNGGWDDSGIQHKMNEDMANQQWPVPDSIGTNDTDGKMNLYVEDNVFTGMCNGGTDFDDGARVTFRYNTLVSSSFNSHGLATSPVGLRHFEIYGNQFTYPDDTVNQNWHIWLRGGAGVIYDNHFDNLIGQMWGDKPELRMSVRAIHDVLCCTTYPCDHQISQNHDGSNPFTDPLYLWDNTGTLEWELATWSDDCGTGQDINDYLAEGRDFIVGNTPKPGYTPYPYPHPLR